ncbi:MAG: redoxin domain-containing protein [Candidatus Eisenbacteria bacterium]
MDRKELKVGDLAPDFTLKDHHDREVNLSGLRGKKIVLGFHPLAWTRVCALQMKDLEASAAQFETLGAIAFGVSVDSVPCKHAWARDLGITKTQLLADFWPHGGVADAFGIFREADGFSERAVFILDPKGTVRFKKIYPIKEVPDIKEIIAEVEKL